MKRTVLLVTLMACLVLLADGQRQKGKKNKGSRKKINAAAMMNDVNMLQANVSELWKAVHHMEHDHDKLTGGEVANVSVNIGGVPGETMMTTHDNSGTHVHVHLHMDMLNKMQSMHGCKSMHGCPSMHGHQTMGGHQSMSGQSMGGHQSMHSKNGNHSMHMKKGMSGKHGMHMMHGKGGMRGMHMMKENNGMQAKHAMHGHDRPWQGSGMNMPSKEYMKMHHWHHPDPDQFVYAKCNMKPNENLDQNENNRITGVIQLRQKMHERLEVRVHLDGFDAASSQHHHGFHVHQFGDDVDSCNSFGGHFNPDETEHGGPESEIRHVGDWGNIECDDQGQVHKNFNDTHAQLLGSHSIMGRGIVIHHHHDDLGKGDSSASKTTGDAGGRLACCVVVWSADQDWDTNIHVHHNNNPQ